MDIAEWICSRIATAIASRFWTTDRRQRAASSIRQGISQKGISSAQQTKVVAEETSVGKRQLRRH